MSLKSANHNSQADRQVRVCVIGGGPAGLGTAKQFLDPPDQFTVHVFEQLTEIGGTWILRNKHATINNNATTHNDNNNHNDNTKQKQTIVDVRSHKQSIHLSSIYEEMRTNLPMPLMSFPEMREYQQHHPHTNIDIQQASFPSHRQVLGYLQRYAKHFGVERCLRLGCVVQDVAFEKLSTDSKPRWFVKVREISTNTTSTHEYDAVIVCNGHFSKPNIPAFTNQHVFRGVISHSHYYFNNKPFGAQNVLVVGNGLSAMEIALEISRNAKCVYQSMTFEQMTSHSLRYTTAVPPISHLKEHSVVFANNLELPIDVILLCTGYLFDYPFLSENTCDRLGLRVGSCIRGLFYQLFCCREPSLSFVGTPMKVVPFPLFEFQAKWIKNVLLGNVALPSVGEMIREEEDRWIQVLEQRKRPQYLHHLESKQWAYYKSVNNILGNKMIKPSEIEWMEKMYLHTIDARLRDASSFRKVQYVLDDSKTGAWHAIEHSKL
eukprot:c6366_g1_i1.p1 GENE.c6366_g1_i1~~c6366_g1_i1.p1  ORF type:complete len:490 (-),score=134.20 c6366_g1_i1:61-1530(-)